LSGQPLRGFTNAYGNAHSYGHANSDGSCQCDGNAHSYGHANSDSYSYSDAYTYTKGYATAAAASNNTAAAPLVGKQLIPTASGGNSRNQPASSRRLFLASSCSGCGRLQGELRVYRSRLS